MKLHVQTKLQISFLPICVLKRPIYSCFYTHKWYRNPYTCLDRSLGFQEFEDSNISRQEAHKVEKVTAVITGRLHP